MKGCKHRLKSTIRKKKKKTYQSEKTFSSWVRSKHLVMKHWWDMMEQAQPTMILPLNVTIKPGQQHRPATGGIWKVNNGKQIKEEDKSLKQDKSGFQFTKFLSSVPLTTWSWRQVQQRKSAASRDHKGHTYMAERTFQRGTPPPGTGKFWRCHRQFRKVAISSCLWTRGLTPECSGIDRILIMILKTLRTEFKDRFPPKFHQKSHKTQKTNIKENNNRDYGYYSQYWKIESFPLRQEKANILLLEVIASTVK